MFGDSSQLAYKMILKHSLYITADERPLLILKLGQVKDH